ncbi:hypothetical protein AB1Y20_018673 [Prymnesium parvum]|uniref:tRNA pseudouridine synthase n=1 Tax=Prymnesium parvum TaxID=97485 RepID=A0AB34JQI4_PRYPA
MREHVRPAYPRGGGGLRFRGKLSYDGTDFGGWQTQPSGNTVQDLLETRLSRLLRCPIHVAASGRTDAGVHAKGQIFHFELPPAASRPGLLAEVPADAAGLAEWHAASAAALGKALSGLPENTGLPPSVHVHGIWPAPPSFHARESRVGVCYAYTVLEGCGCPFTSRYCWAVGRRALDVERMAEAAQLLVGEHDFSTFAVRNPTDSRTPVKRMRRLDVTREPHYSGLAADGGGGVVVIRAECDRFLQHMMRLISGTLVQVGLGRVSVSDMASLLHACGRKDLSIASLVFKAPPQGLCLERCFYAEDCPDGWVVAKQMEQPCSDGVPTTTVAAGDNYTSMTDHEPTLVMNREALTGTDPLATPTA